MRTGSAAQWLALPILAWGSTYLVVEKTLPAAPPLMLAELRAVFGGLFLLGLAMLLGRSLIGRQWLWAAVLGVFNTAIVSVGIMVGTERIGPALSAVLTNSAPFFMALLGLVFLGERIRSATVGALVIGFGGVVLIVWDRLAQESGSFDLGVGVGLTLAGSLSFAVATVIARRLGIGSSAVDLLSLTGWQLLFGAIALFPLAAPGFDETDWTTSRLWLGVAFLTVAIFSHWVWFKALTGLTTARAGSFTFLVPVVAVLIEFGRANVPSPLELAGIALVIVGIYMGTRVPSHAVEPVVLPQGLPARVRPTEEAI